jgi:SAM-dependent methyltransferase
VTALAAAGRALARLATVLVVRAPWLWPLFRRVLERQFDWLAPRWDGMRTPGHLAPLQAALEAVDGPPRRVLDVGTGTGAAAFEVAGRWPEAEVVGVDLSARMVEQARRKTPPGLTDRVRFERADSASLPFADGSFDLAVLANMIPFFDELERVVAPAGYALFSFSDGPRTPIYVPPARLRAALAARGFSEFADFSAGPGTALLARKPRAPLV